MKNNNHLPVADQSDPLTSNKAKVYYPIFNNSRLTSKKRKAEDYSFTENRHQRSCYVIEFQNPPASAKIAAFDLDHTLIKTKSGNKFPKNDSDWTILYPGQVIENKLSQLVRDGYKIVLFTNQAGIGDNKQKLKDFVNKIEQISLHIHIPMQIFIATQKDYYRKPRIGMFDLLANQYNSDIPIDKLQSFYVGDAAGRPEGWNRALHSNCNGNVSLRSGDGSKRDFADSDRKYALNLGLPFFTPEEYFLNHLSAPFSLGKHKIEPGKFIQIRMAEPVITLETYIQQPCPPKNEIIIFVGPPASGKSTISQWICNQFPNYTSVNQDTLKSLRSCIQETRKCLESNRSVVIDNTNPTAHTRANYVALSKEFRTNIRVIHLHDIDYEIAVHLDCFRWLTTNRPRLPAQAFHQYFSRFEDPDMEAEGFQEIIKIPFLPRFLNETHAKTACLWLL